MPEQPGEGGHEQYPDDGGGGGGIGIGMGIDLGIGIGGISNNKEDGEQRMMMSLRHHHHHQHHNSSNNNGEWLDMRQSSLRLTSTDVDDQFLKTITDLMKQFPEPPTRDNPIAIAEVSSPGSIIGGRLGLHMPKTSSQRRAASGMGSAMMLGASHDAIIQPRQNPMFQQQLERKQREAGGSGNARELGVPVRISYSKPEDEFSL